MKSLSFLPLLALFAAPALAAPPGMSVTFDGWVVGCDNGDNCRAVSILGISGEFNEGPTLSLYRKGGKAGLLGVLQFDASMQEGSSKIPAAIAVDGHTIETGEIARARDASSPYHDVAENRWNIPVAVEAMRAMAAGEKLSFVDAEGNTQGEYPLMGLKYALRFIDAQQWREGTVTAVMAPGEKGADHVYSGEDYPTYYIPPRKSGEAPFELTGEEARQWQRKFGCWELGQGQDGGPRAMEISRLDDDHALAFVSCTMGAYQGSGFALVIDKSGAQPARYDFGTDIWSDIPVELVTGGGFDEGTGVLGGFAKGRGLGDCGTSYAWIWDPKGELFRLTDWNEMPECRGLNDWIERYRARIVYGDPPSSESP